MLISLHRQATTTPKIRAEIQASTEPAWILAERFGISEQTVYKWRKRDSVYDRSHTPHRLQTTLTSAQERIAVELRKLLLLPIDDLLSVVRAFLNPNVSRSGLDRCLRRHGMAKLRELKPKEQKSWRKSLVSSAPGYLRIVVKDLPQIADEQQRRCLFVAIDRATRWVFVRIYPVKTVANARRFLRDLERDAPMVIAGVLTESGKEFTDRLFGLRRRAGTGSHAFDQFCAELGIERSLVPTMRPQADALVERFNGRIEDVLQGHHFCSGEELEQSLLRCVRIYNGQLTQAGLRGRTPAEAIGDWACDALDPRGKEQCDHPGTESEHRHLEAERAELQMLNRDTVRWRARSDRSEAAALSEAAIDRLSAAFDLDRDDLASLSSNLSTVLTAHRAWEPKEWTAAQTAKGEKEIRAALAGFAKAQMHLERARKRLTLVALEVPGLFPRRDLGPAYLENLDRAAAMLSEVAALYANAPRETDIRYKRAANKKILRDERRRRVCSVLCEFWLSAGRSLGVSTGSGEHDRYGPLIRFIDTVVRELIEDAERKPLKVGAIRDEIVAFRERKGFRDPSGPLRRARSVEEEAKCLLERIDREVADPAHRLIRLAELRDQHQRIGIDGKHVSDLRLALLLSEAIVARAGTAVEQVAALDGLASTLMALGEVTWDPERMEEAVGVRQQAVALLEVREDQRAWATAQLNLASTLEARESMAGERLSPPAAMAAYEAVLAELDRASETELWVQAKTSLGRAIAERGTLEALDEAETHLRCALETAERHNDALRHATALYGLAQCLADKIDLTADRTILEEAFSLADAALDMARGLGARRLSSDIQILLSLLVYK